MIFPTREKIGKFLGIWRQELYKYKRQIQKTRGRYYPVYLPIKFFKRCMDILDKGFLYYLERNIAEIRVRVGLSVYNPVLPIKESKEIYRIMAHMIADGSASKGKTPYYANTCKELRDQFKNDLKVFGNMKIYERKSNTVEFVNFPKIVTDILSYLFDIQFTYPNRLPRQIFASDEIFKSLFLQALFDDEGSISTGLTISIHNVNIMGEVKLLINSLGIKTSKVMIHPYFNQMDKVYLQIPTSEYKIFQRKIGFAHQEKAKKLEFAIRTQNREQKTRDLNHIEQKILEILEYRSSLTMELANELMFTLNGIMPHLDRMLEEGLIVKRGYKNRVIWDIA